MSALEPLEKPLEDIFVKQAPPLPDGAKKWLVQYLPWINLIAGIFSLWAAWALYHTAHTVNALVDYVNSVSAAYGSTVKVNHLTFTVWLAIATLAVAGLIYLFAFPATRERKKSGWDLMFYALLLNLVYGVVAAFTDYGGVGRLIGAVIGAAIGLYFLFQIRESYLKSVPASSKK